MERIELKEANIDTFALTDRNIYYLENNQVPISGYNVLVLNVLEQHIKKDSFLLNEVEPSSQSYFNLLIDMLHGIIKLIITSRGATNKTVLVYYELLQDEQENNDSFPLHLKNQQDLKNCQEYTTLFPQFAMNNKHGFRWWIFIAKEKQVPEHKCHNAKPKGMLVGPKTKEINIDKYFVKFLKIRNGETPKKNKYNFDDSNIIYKGIPDTINRLYQSFHKFSPIYKWSNDSNNSNQFSVVLNRENLFTLGDTYENQNLIQTRLQQNSALIHYYIEVYNKDGRANVGGLNDYISKYTPEPNGNYKFPHPRNVLFFPSQKFSTKMEVMDPWAQKFDLNLLFKAYDYFSHYQYDPRVLQMLNVDRVNHQSSTRISEPLLQQNNTINNPGIQSNVNDVNEESAEEDDFEQNVISQQIVNDNDITERINNHISTNSIYSDFNQTKTLDFPINQSSEKEMMTPLTEKEIWKTIFENKIGISFFGGDKYNSVQNFIVYSRIMYSRLFETDDFKKVSIEEAAQMKKKFFMDMCPKLMELLRSKNVPPAYEKIFQKALGYFDKESKCEEKVYNWSLKSEFYQHLSKFGVFVITTLAKYETLLHIHHNHKMLLFLFLNVMTIYNLENEGLSNNVLIMGKADTGKSKILMTLLKLLIEFTARIESYKTDKGEFYNSPDILGMITLMEELTNKYFKSNNNEALVKQSMANNKISCKRLYLNPSTGRLEPEIIDKVVKEIIYAAHNGNASVLSEPIISRFMMTNVIETSRIDKNISETISDERNPELNNEDKKALEEFLEFNWQIQTFCCLLGVMIKARMIEPPTQTLSDPFFAKTKEFFGKTGSRSTTMISELSNSIIWVNSFLETFVDTDKKFLLQNFYYAQPHMYPTVETIINTLALTECFEDPTEELLKSKLENFFQKDQVNSQTSNLVERELGKYRKEIEIKPLERGDGHPRDGDNNIDEDPLIEQRIYNNNGTYNRDRNLHGANNQNKPKNETISVLKRDLNYYSKEYDSLQSLYYALAGYKTDGGDFEINLNDGKKFSFCEMKGNLSKEQIEYSIGLMRKQTITSKWIICSEIVANKETIFFPDDENCNEEERYFTLQEWKEYVKDFDSNRYPPSRYVDRNGNSVHQKSVNCTGVYVKIEPSCLRNTTESMIQTFPIIKLDQVDLPKNKKQKIILLHRSFLNEQEKIKYAENLDEKERIINEDINNDIIVKDCMQLYSQLREKPLKLVSYILKKNFLNQATNEKNIVFCLTPSPYVAPNLVGTLLLKKQKNFVVECSTVPLRNLFSALGGISQNTNTNSNKISQRIDRNSIVINEQTSVENFNYAFRNDGEYNVMTIDFDEKSLKTRMIALHLIPTKENMRLISKNREKVQTNERCDEILEKYPDQHISTILSHVHRREVAKEHAIKKKIYEDWDLYDQLEDNQKEIIRLFDLRICIETSYFPQVEEKIKKIDEYLNYKKEDIVKILREMVSDLVTQQKYEIDREVPKEIEEKIILLFKKLCDTHSKMLRHQHKTNKKLLKNQNAFADVKDNLDILFNVFEKGSQLESQGDHSEIEELKKRVVNKFDKEEIDFDKMFSEMKIFKNSKVDIYILCGTIDLVFERRMGSFKSIEAGIQETQRELFDNEKLLILDREIINEINRTVKQGSTSDFARIDQSKRNSFYQIFILYLIENKKFEIMQTKEFKSKTIFEVDQVDNNYINNTTRFIGNTHPLYQNMKEILIAIKFYLSDFSSLWKSNLITALNDCFIVDSMRKNYPKMLDDALIDVLQSERYTNFCESRDIQTDPEIINKYKTLNNDYKTDIRKIYQYLFMNMITQKFGGNDIKQHKDSVNIQYVVGLLRIKNKLNKLKEKYKESAPRKHSGKKNYNQNNDDKSSCELTDLFPSTKPPNFVKERERGNQNYEEKRENLTEVIDEDEDESQDQNNSYSDCDHSFNSVKERKKKRAINKDNGDDKRSKKIKISVEKEVNINKKARNINLNDDEDEDSGKEDIDEKEIGNRKNKNVLNLNSSSDD